MQTIVRNKVGASFLVVGAFMVWIVGSRFIPAASSLHMTMSYFIGAFAFLIVGCFLPETRDKSFFSRKSALGLMGFFVLLGSSHYFLKSNRLLGDSPMLGMMLSALITAGSYYFGLFLIRGFRADPEYNNEEERIASPDRDKQSC
jgi:DMSO/TMAO reductase YedYZ heme-binding membrane subunit